MAQHVARKQLATKGKKMLRYAKNAYIFIPAMSYQIDARHMVFRFGGKNLLWKKLVLSGVLVQPRTISTWIRRRKIPLEKFAALVALAHREGWVLRLEDVCHKLKRELENEPEKNAGGDSQTAVKNLRP
jgi:hypothetical protein